MTVAAGIHTPAVGGGSPRDRIGQLLLDAGLIRPDQLDEALRQQRRQGGDLGSHLVSAGNVGAYELYRTLSGQWDAPMIDLTERPPMPELLAGLDHRVILTRGWMPVQLHDRTLVIASTVRPTPALLREAAAESGADTVVARTITARDLTTVVALLYRQPLLFSAAEQLSVSRPDLSARDSLRRWQRAIPVLGVIVLVLGLAVDPGLTLFVSLLMANICFGLNISFKVFASVRWPWHVMTQRTWNADLVRERERRGLPAAANDRIPDADLPVYSILVPAFREANVISKVIEHLRALDYPISKLDVLVLLEEDDTDTIAAARAARPPEFVRILIVPRGHPQTKPRACNYGLLFARGEYVVIYDAEDRPDPDQLRRVVADFRRARTEQEAGLQSDPLACVQCALNYFNSDYNVLTRMFTIEYSHWFDAMLPGLDRTGIPIPLGGTSNHFDTVMLRDLGGWDPYNVTEDADLGLRLAALGYRVGINSSTTWEEACSRTGAWLKQRTRWIKGYMITGAVVCRHPVRFWRATGLRGLLCLSMLILGTPAAFMLYPLVLTVTVISYIDTHLQATHLPPWLLAVGAANMVIGNLSMITVSAVATWRRHGWRTAAFALLSPVYWLLHSAAAWRAAWQALASPHHWEKTPHGLTEDETDD
jgi:cellulose synthase/poly-beta-1,6-N-acetylglucosamine synthase-like glycosyltransferase